MDTENPLASFKEMETHLVKLRIIRDTHALRLENHWLALRDKEVRAVLFKGAVQDAVQDFKPAQKITELLTGGGITSQLIMGMITRRGGILRRLLTSVAVMAAPNLLTKAMDMVRTKVGHGGHELNGHGHS